MARPKSELGDIRTSPRSVRILKWLRRKPQPARIVGEMPDGEEVPCAVNVTGSSTWTDVLSVVRGCTTLKAFDKDDNELRRLALDPDDPELRAEAEMAEALTSVAKHGGAVPIISVDVPKLVDNIARNIREVAMEAARANAGAHKEGFAAMVSVVNIALGLLVGVEQRLARAEQQLEAAHTTNEDPEQNRQQLALLALQQAMGGQPGASNGAARTDPAALMQLMQSLQQQQAEPEE